MSPYSRTLGISWIRVSSAIWPDALCVIWLRLMVPQGVCGRERAGKREIETCRRVWNPYNKLASLPFGSGTMGQAPYSVTGLGRS